MVLRCTTKMDKRASITVFYFRNRYERIGNQKRIPRTLSLVGPTGGSVERCEDYPLDLSPFANRKIVFVTCGTQLDWAKNNLIIPNEAVS